MGIAVVGSVLPQLVWEKLQPGRGARLGLSIVLSSRGRGSSFAPAATPSCGIPRALLPLPGTCR
eukprot:3339222-Pyramimonas_sp.AAC.1